MAAGANPKKITIPRKNTRAKDKDLNQNDADINWRAIEDWANNLNPILQLIAGANITLTPADGLGPTVEIAASGGGGGGGGNANLILISGADSAEFGSQLVFLGPSEPTTFGFSWWPVFDNSSGADRFYTPASNWIVAVLAGESVCVFPEVRGPFFTGGPIGISFQIQTWAINETNVVIYQTNPISFTSGMNYQTQDTDYTLIVNGGGDIVLTAGSGTTGNGLVSQAGGFYIASVTTQVTIPTGTTMTGDGF
jgi:hypothetical protein